MINTASAQSASPTLQDAQNLAEVMSGAREKINPEIPKDKYGRPLYRIGNLGGSPVRLPQGIEYLEYSDSPGWNPEAIKNYNPEKRTYDSVIESFGFEFRNSDLVIYNFRDNDLYKAKMRDFENPETFDWIDVTIRSGKAYGDEPEALTKSLKSRINREYTSPDKIYERLEKEDKYGLEVYVNPGINPETNKPWREELIATDLFIARDEKGLVKTYISCFNANVPFPPCNHHG